MHIVLFFCTIHVFHCLEKSFLITGIELKLRHLIIKKETLEKTILLYIIVTVSHGTYLGIFQSMKRKFVALPKIRGKLILIS